MKARRAAVRALRRLGARLRPAGAILCYHRVAPPVDDPWGMSVAPERFERHMAAVRHLARPVRVADLIATAAAGRSTRGQVAVSFDDGYGDNLETALPLLERFDVPATLFVCTGLVDARRPPWWDELAAAVGSPRAAGRRVPCPGGEPIELRADPAGRRGQLGRLHAALRPLEEGAREAALVALARALEVPLSERPTTMSAEALRAFAAHPLTDVGGHSCTHPSLAGLPAERLRAETAGCRERLRELTGTVPAGFAYPFGQTADVDRAAVDAARAAGFEWACVAAAGVVRPGGGERLAVPRLWVHDLGGPEFERFLAGWVA